MDRYPDDYYGFAKFSISQVLRAMPATFLPIYGFWTTTLPFMKKYASWYNLKSTPSDIDELANLAMLKGLIKADKEALELTSQIKQLEKKLEGFNAKSKGVEIEIKKKKSCSSPSRKGKREDTGAVDEKQKQKLIDELKQKNEDLKIATTRAKNAVAVLQLTQGDAVEDCDEGGQISGPDNFQLPNIYWIMLATSVGVGFSSFLVWRDAGGFEGAALPLATYGTQLALHWTYYPVLFYIGSYEWSLIHISLTTIVSVITTLQFTTVNGFAGLLMMPYLYFLAYTVFHNYTVGKEVRSKRALTEQIGVIFQRYKVTALEIGKDDKKPGGSIRITDSKK